MNRSFDADLRSVSHASLARIFDTVANAIFITDEAGRIVWVNAAFSRMSAYSPQELIGRTPAILHAGMQDKAFYTRLWETILAGHVWQGEVVERRKDGSSYTVDEVIAPLFNEDGVVSHFIAIQHETGARKKGDDTDHYLAYHDALTGLPNRLFFLSILQLVVAHAERAHQMLAVLFLDLDGFASVNEQLGHRAGDHLLAIVAERLRAAVHRQDTVARFGGNAFTVVLTEIQDRDAVAALSAALMEAVARPAMLDGRKIELGASIGVSVYPDDGADAKTLLGRADQAMQEAKRQGGHAFRFYRSI
ncbi:MAG TPA: diguanylate cyclase [Noviherbaspirillum sp.]|uniref:diguanylate cyclase domain-containing protein n=1 Tax=Noviherbaspirillum sp. TaxID=1926288 RepID=UPI002B484CB5|nr:diguanylate cyclase [Noviherbaspirillum sp.]HJV88563.1 diguanylate cyclase [Noviherbaspirillum sp.]